MVGIKGSIYSGKSHWYNRMKGCKALRLGKDRSYIRYIQQLTRVAD